MTGRGVGAPSSYRVLRVIASCVALVFAVSGCGGSTGTDDEQSELPSDDSSAGEGAQGDGWSPFGEALCATASPQTLAAIIQSSYGLTNISAQPGDNVADDEARSAICRATVLADGRRITDLSESDANAVAARGDCGSVGDVLLVVGDIHYSQADFDGNVIRSDDQYAYYLDGTQVMLPATTAVELLDSVEQAESTAGPIDEVRRLSERQLVVGPKYFEAVGEHVLVRLDAYSRSVGSVCDADLPFFNSVMEVIRPVLQTSLPPPEGDVGAVDPEASTTTVSTPPAASSDPGSGADGEPTLGVTSSADQIGIGTVAPAEFTTGDPVAGLVREIAWSNWGDAEATASGRVIYSELASDLVGVVASDLGECQGTIAYRLVEWFAPEQGQSQGNGSQLDVCPD